LSDVDALFVACIRRALSAQRAWCATDARHPERDSLIRLFDIHLLISGMSIASQEEFVSMAAMKGIRRICHDAIQAANSCFATPLAPRTLERLAQGSVTEPSTRYLAGGLMRRALADFMALDRWTERRQWLRGVTFAASS